ncbi:MAG: sigma-70 family RNA polymerase sigma factor [Coriobacteriales bacterium]
MLPRDDIERTMNAHGATVWRVCMGYFRTEHDAQDAFQDTFVKYALADATAFNDDSHRKAWLIKVASNVCKDMLKARRRSEQPLDEALSSEALVSHDSSTQPDSGRMEFVEAFRSLDDPPRLPLYLALYEGYTAPEIADMLDAPVNTVYSWISRGKKLLKEALS